jgi:hypothetical protein
VFAFAGTIFKVGINAYRTAVANAEIMQKLRAITDQLNADFKGVLWNPEMRIHFDESNDIRSDSIVFFANGDFQSTKQYQDKNSGKYRTVSGNVACIFYFLADVSITNPREKVLVRRQKILTCDSSLDTFKLNEKFEYCNENEKSSLSELIADPGFDANDLMYKKNLDLNDSNDLVAYMAKGVDDFTIQYVGGENPDQGKRFNVWRPENSEVIGWPTDLYPRAFKFTFTLYDSKGVIKEGREFTHIVYLGE